MHVLKMCSVLWLYVRVMYNNTTTYSIQTPPFYFKPTLSWLRKGLVQMPNRRVAIVTKSRAASSSCCCRATEKTHP